PAVEFHDHLFVWEQGVDFVARNRGAHERLRQAVIVAPGGKEVLPFGTRRSALDLQQRSDSARAWVVGEALDDIFQLPWPEAHAPSPVVDGPGELPVGERRRTVQDRAGGTGHADALVRADVAGREAFGPVDLDAARTAIARDRHVDATP